MAADRNRGLDSGRTIAFVAVVLLHTVGSDPSPAPSAAKVADLLARFAVPFFFLAAGYFSVRHAPGAYLARLARRVLPVYVAGTVFYHLAIGAPALDLSDGAVWRSWLLEGGAAYHLWFLPALLTAAGLSAALERLAPAGAVLAGALALYAAGVLHGPYRDLLGLPETGWSFRDGVFIGLAFFQTGRVAARAAGVPAGAAAVLALAGFLVQLMEASLLHATGTRGFADDINAYVGTYPYAVGLFLVALRVRGTPVLAALGRHSFTLYCLHPLAIFAVAGDLRLVGDAVPAAEKWTTAGLAVALSVVAGVGGNAVLAALGIGAGPAAGRTALRRLAASAAAAAGFEPAAGLPLAERLRAAAAALPRRGRGAAAAAGGIFGIGALVAADQWVDRGLADGATTIAVGTGIRLAAAFERSLLFDLPTGALPLPALAAASAVFVAGLLFWSARSGSLVLLAGTVALGAGLGANLLEMGVRGTVVDIDALMVRAWTVRVFSPPETLVIVGAALVAAAALTAVRANRRGGFGGGAGEPAGRRGTVRGGGSRPEK